MSFIGARSDTQIERDRYEGRALELLRRPGAQQGTAERIPALLATPYSQYARALSRVLRPGMTVMEIGAGTGSHSELLCIPDVEVTFTDISPSALMVLRQRLAAAGKTATTMVAPMESTPFPDSSFDLVASAGSLSYADPITLDDEIARILRRGGSFICVDSLNHNPVYRLNRWAHWRIRGDRTRSTLLRMPTLARMERFGRRFERWSLRGFGAWSWLWTPMSRIVGPGLAAKCNDACDGLPGSRRLAFKFVFEAHGLRK